MCHAYTLTQDTVESMTHPTVTEDGHRAPDGPASDPRANSVAWPITAQSTDERRPGWPGLGGQPAVSHASGQGVCGGCDNNLAALGTGRHAGAATATRRKKKPLGAEESSADRRSRRFQTASQGFSNATLRQHVAALRGPDATYRPSQMTDDIRRLVRNGVIARLPHTQRYRLTPLGLQAVHCFTKLVAWSFKPAAASCVLDDGILRPLTLAFDQLEAAMQARTPRHNSDRPPNAAHPET